MQVLISGGSGLIGQAVTKELVRNGHGIVILSRNPANVADQPDGVRVIGWDAQTTGGWGQVMNEVDAVVHLAGVSLSGSNPFNMRWTAKKKKAIRDSRLQTGAALLHAIREAKTPPKVFIQSSAIGYYGARGGEIVREGSSKGIGFLAELSEEWEDSTREVEALGLRRVVIRTGLVLDGEDGAFPFFKLQYALFAGGRIGSGKQYYSWIHIDDMGKAIRFLIENDAAEGVVNLTAPNPETNRDFGKILGKVMGRPSWMVVPAFLLKLVLGEASSVVLTGQNVIPDKLLKLGYSFEYTELEPALRDIL